LRSTETEYFYSIRPDDGDNNNGGIDADVDGLLKAIAF
jgi:hypothetical protein